MNPLSAEDFVAWADQLAGLSWPLDLDVFRDAVTGLGWSPTDRPWEFVVDFSNGTRRVVLFGGKSGGIHNISFPLFTPEAESAENTARLNDLFASYEAAGTQAWGRPFHVDLNEDPTLTWRLPGDCGGEVVGGSDLILLTFFTPQGAFIYE